MKAKDLIQRLSEMDPEQEVMILDGFNGGGYPRTINLGPMLHTITENDRDKCADCECAEERVIIMGYGCY